jgi:hypothetical protein
MHHGLEAVLSLLCEHVMSLARHWRGAVRA